MMTTIAADLHNRWFQAKEEEKMALARFQWSCYSNDPIVPMDSTLSLFYTGISDGSLSEHILPTFKARQMKRKQCFV